ncbi:MAG: hypothetical protein Q7K98_02015 [Candidatus Omnitrophota bacterium]|nr:hypothetical protein [Candidatus Omnitrophota bacterium]
MKKYIIFLLFFLALNINVYCGQESRIELTDGSVLNGEVTSLASGTYTINTASMGVIKIDAAKVAKIESVKSSALSSAINLTPAQINSYKQKIMGNPDAAAAIKSLSANPQIKALAEDPEIVNAAKSGNIQELFSNKKFTDVLESPEIQETAKKIKQ